MTTLQGKLEQDEGTRFKGQICSEGGPRTNCDGDNNDSDNDDDGDDDDDDDSLSIDDISTWKSSWVAGSGWGGTGG